MDLIKGKNEIYRNFVVVKAIFHNIMATFLAVMVLLSTVSWTVDKHLCMGRVMDISLFTEADDCGMEAAMAAMMEDGAENHCCDDESFTLSGQEDLKLSLFDLELEQQFFLVAFTQSYINLILPLREIPVSTKEYPPPLITRDIHILDQVFLI